MLNLTRVFNECQKELDKIGIPYGKIRKIQVNHRAKKRWGLCKPTPEGFIIEVSYRLLTDNAMAGLKNTIIHELLHTCPGCLNHGREWQKLADKVNRAYGYGIQRTSRPDEKGVAELPTQAYKHKVICCKCGKEIYKMRECGITQNPENWRCGICGGDFRRVY